jgi:hypothetical protein
LAEPLLRDAVTGQTAQLGPNDPRTLQSKHNLALLYRCQFKAAVLLIGGILRIALSMIERIVG